MDENDIFLADGDTLVYLVKPMHKKYSTVFVLGHPFNTYVSYDRFFNPLTLYAPVHILDDPPPSSPPFLQFCTYLMDGLFLNQKTNNNIRISYSLKYKHSKKKFFFLRAIHVQRYYTWSHSHCLTLMPYYCTL